MKNISKRQLAKQYWLDTDENVECSNGDYYDGEALRAAYIAGWDARKQLEEELLTIFSCACLKRLQEIE